MPRTETWTKPDEGMLTSFDVTVFLGERVHVSPSVVAELGLDPGLGKDIAIPSKETFALEYHYQAVADALSHSGYSLASPE